MEKLESIDFINQRMKEATDRSLVRSGLCDDAMNDWTILAHFSENASEKVADLARQFPIKKYCDFFGPVNRADGTADENESALHLYIRNSSDPKRVEKYDALVDEVTADIERVLIERDAEAADRYVARAKEMLYGKNEKSE